MSTVATKAPTENTPSTHTKADAPFWLTLGQDDPAACRTRPHAWTTLRLGDVLVWTLDPDEEITICKRCYAPRCGKVGDEDRCLCARHHRIPHQLPSGLEYPVGGSPSDAE